MTTPDLFSEAWSALAERPLRSTLTALGTILGIAALVSIVGITSSAQAQVSNRFDRLAATQVSIQDQRPDGSAPFPPNTEVILRALNGVQAAGVLWNVSGPAKIVTPPTGGGPVDLGQGIYAATPGVFDVVHALWSSGQAYDRFAQDRADRVAVLGVAAAQQLGVAHAGPDEAIFIDGAPYTVVGIMASADRRPDLLVGILIPTTTASRTWGSDPSVQALVETRPGAASLIGRQAPVALQPGHPTRLTSLVPPDPKLLRRQVGSDLQILLLSLGSVCLFIGMVSIANTTLVSVMERVPEIGLRRAQGARRTDIAKQFLLESAILGLAGGFVGAAAGVIAVSLVCIEQQWAAVLPLQLLPAAPAMGLVVGLIAGVYPAIKAASFAPADALRR